MYVYLSHVQDLSLTLPQYETAVNNRPRAKPLTQGFSTTQESEIPLPPHSVIHGVEIESVQRDPFAVTKQSTSERVQTTPFAHEEVKSPRYNLRQSTPQRRQSSGLRELDPNMQSPGSQTPGRKRNRFSNPQTTTRTPRSVSKRLKSSKMHRIINAGDRGSSPASEV